MYALKVKFANKTHLFLAWNQRTIHEQRKLIKHHKRRSSTC